MNLHEQFGRFGFDRFVAAVRKRLHYLNVWVGELPGQTDRTLFVRSSSKDLFMFSETHFNPSWTFEEFVQTVKMTLRINVGPSKMVRARLRRRNHAREWDEEILAAMKARNDPKYPRMKREFDAQYPPTRAELEAWAHEMRAR